MFNSAIILFYYFSFKLWTLLSKGGYLNLRKLSGFTSVVKVIAKVKKYSIDRNKKNINAIVCSLKFRNMCSESY